MAKCYLENCGSVQSEVDDSRKDIYTVVLLLSMSKSSTQEYSEVRSSSRWKTPWLPIDSIASGSHSEQKRVSLTLAGVAFVVEEGLDPETGGGAPKL